MDERAAREGGDSMTRKQPENAEDLYARYFPLAPRHRGPLPPGDGQ